MKVKSLENQLLYFVIEEYLMEVLMYLKNFGHRLWMNRVSSQVLKIRDMMQ